MIIHITGWLQVIDYALAKEILYKCGFSQRREDGDTLYVFDRGEPGAFYVKKTEKVKEVGSFASKPPAGESNGPDADDHPRLVRATPGTGAAPGTKAGCCGIRRDSKRIGRTRDCDSSTEAGRNSTSRSGPGSA